MALFQWEKLLGELYLARLDKFYELKILVIIAGKEAISFWQMSKFWPFSVTIKLLYGIFMAKVLILSSN